MQNQNFKKKLIKNEILFQYSHYLATNEFFRQFIQKRKKVTINELIDNYGLPTTTPGEMLEHVKKFYAELYRCDPTDLAKQNLFLDYIIAGLSDQQKSNLQIDFSEQEIETAVSQMANGKAPSSDRLRNEFYTHI